MQDPEKEYETPRVSPYRLAAHLGSAFLIYSTLLWTSFTLASPESRVLGRFTGAVRLRTWALPLTALIALTGMSGEEP
jgi:cytochrome c oxidase assembly protein subunit 15